MKCGPTDRLGPLRLTSESGLAPGIPLWMGVKPALPRLQLANPIAETVQTFMRSLARRASRFQRGIPPRTAQQPVGQDAADDPRIDLMRAMERLIVADTVVARANAAQNLHRAADRYTASPLTLPSANMMAPSLSDQQMLVRFGKRLAVLSDKDLERFNEVLPWAAMTAAPGGRIVGRPWNATKRHSLNELIDPRLSSFDRELPLKGLQVLEAGCFEGIHTIGCAALGGRVTAFDGRIENLVKTMARLWAYKLSCELLLWNAESAPPTDLPASWDILHHIGVLYHLSNPVQHLECLLPRTRLGVLLDSHVARTDCDKMEEMEVGGQAYRYLRYAEVHADISPFSGLADHAKWLRLDDLLDLLRHHGFGETKVVSERMERNGQRATIFAFRTRR
jgi:2-polyprenyl-3-methyl-5-hydroxy-6-metoxy-1,4-benzoquinol methylase